MPEIPTFVSTQSYGSPAVGGQIPISTAMQASNALAEGFDRISAQFAQAAERAQETQRAADALNISTSGAEQLADMSLKFAQDPDPSTAPQRYRDATTELRKTLLEQSSDPRVQRMVQQHFDQRALAGYVDLSQSAIKRVNATATASMIGDITRQALTLTTAANPSAEDASVDMIQRGIRAQVASGAISQGQGDNVFSQAMKQAIVLRANQEGGATRAQSLFDRVKDRMASDDIITVDSALSARVAAEGVAGDIALSTGARPSYSAHGGAAPVGGLDSEFGRVIQLESGGRQLGADGNPLTSSAGAIGVAQVMPQTARLVAQSLGETLDEDKYRTDEAYNKRLGREYYRQMRERFGNPTMAAAAYNAGPGRVEEWIKQNGDPRTGQIPMADWVAKIPIAETRNYVTKFGIESVDSRDANIEPSAPTEPSLHGPAARGVAPNVTGVPSLASMIANAERITEGRSPAHRQRVIAGVIQQYNQQQTIATADLKHQLEMQEKLDAAVKRNMDHAQDQVFTAFVGKIAGGEDIPAQSLTLALSTQSISRSHYEFLDKVATSRREGVDEPRTVLDLNTALLTQDQQPRILAAANEGRLSNKTAVELVRRNQEARQKPFKNADEEQGYRQVTTLLGGERGILEPIQPAEAQRIVMGQREYVDRIRGGERPGEVVSDIVGRYMSPMPMDKVPLPRFSQGVPADINDLRGRAQQLEAAKQSGRVSDGDYQAERRILDQYARSMEQARPPPPLPARGSQPRSSPFGGGR